MRIYLLFVRDDIRYLLEFSFLFYQLFLDYLELLVRTTMAIIPATSQVADKVVVSLFSKPKRRELWPHNGRVTMDRDKWEIWWQTRRIWPDDNVGRAMASDWAAAGGRFPERKQRIDYPSTSCGFTASASSAPLPFHPLVNPLVIQSPAESTVSESETSSNNGQTMPTSTIHSEASGWWSSWHATRWSSVDDNGWESGTNGRSYTRTSEEKP